MKRDRGKNLPSLLVSILVSSRQHPPAIRPSPPTRDEEGRRRSVYYSSRRCTREIKEAAPGCSRARDKQRRDRFARAGQAAASPEFAMASDRSRRKYACGRAYDAKFPKMPSTFANLLEAHFFVFGKNPRMPSPFSKLLELLLGISIMA